MTDVILLVGGLGTRLKGMLGDVPKSMALIAGTPFLEYQLAYLRAAGLHNVILSVGYLNDQIINHFANNWKGMGLLYSIESEPLGTGGALKQAIKFCTSESVMVMNGDTLFPVDLSKMYKMQKKHNADAIIALRKVPDAGRYGKVLMDWTGKILEFREKDTKVSKGLISGGIYLLKRKIIERTCLPDKFSLEHDFFPIACRTRHFRGIEFKDYFLDIGIPEDLAKAQVDFPAIGKRYGATR